MHICAIFSWLLFASFLSNMGFAVTYSVLISNNLSGTVSVVRLPDGTVTSTIPVGSDPFGIITNAAMTTAYVANGGSGTVSVIDVPRQQVTAMIPVGDGPILLAITPDGTKVYVTNLISSNVSVIDTATNMVIATIPVGGLPYGIVITPDGTKAYVANTNTAGFSVTVIDATSGNLTSNMVIAIISTGAASTVPLSITPNGAYVYMADNSANTVSVISTASDMLLTTITLGSTGPKGVFITPDGTTAYVPTSSSNLVYVIDTSTNTLEGSITVGNGPIDVAFSPDGSTAYVLNSGDATISVIDVGSSSVIGAPIPIANPVAEAFAPDGAELIVTSSLPAGILNIINPATDIIETSVAVGENPINIAFGVTILPPSGFTGKQKKHRFLTQTDILNVISWSAPSSGVVPVVYRIYRDNLNTLIGVVPATGPLVFEDHNRKKGTSYTYYLISEGALGETSFSGSVTISP